MRPNPLYDAVQFLTKPAWFTAVFWLLLLASIAIALSAWARVPEQRTPGALAIWLLIGRYLVAKLAGSGVADWPVTLPLKGKVTSTIGLIELVPVSCVSGVAKPLASGYLSLQALAGSDGWIVVPADSEGFAAGTPVAVRPWP